MGSGKCDVFEQFSVEWVLGRGTCRCNRKLQVYLVFLDVRKYVSVNATDAHEITDERASMVSANVNAIVTVTIPGHRGN